MNLTKLVEALLPADAATLLDIGCGLCRIVEDLPVKVRVGLDIHRPYLERAKITATDIALVNADARGIQDLFMEDSFDVVTLVDVVEHFTKRQGQRLLRQAQHIAKKQVIVFAPRGKDPQTGDAWGMGGEKYQRHRSDWQPADFRRLGFRLLVLEKFHAQKDLDAILAYL